MPTKDDSIPTDMRDLLIRLDQRVDDGFRNINSKLDEMNRRADGHEVRIRSLEDWRATIEGGKKGIVGAAAVIKWAWPIAAGAAAFFGVQALDHPKAVEAKTVATTSVVTTRPASGN